MLLRLTTSVVAISARRPRTVLLLAATLLALSIGVLSGSRIDSTLSGMLGGENPAAEALARITDDFHAAEDLLVLASAPSSVPVAQAQQQLLEYAERFSAAAETPAAGGEGITRIRYRPDPSFETYFREIVLPSGVLWLDNDSFQALVQRLSPEEVRGQLAQNETMLAAPGPGAALLAKQLMKDPLRLREFLMARFAHISMVAPSADFSDDRHALLIRVSGARPVNDIEFAKQFTGAVRQMADEINTGGLEIRIGGGYAVAASTATAIRRDAIGSTVGSASMILLLLAIAYRRLLAPFTIIVTAGTGVVVAFGVYALWVYTITPLTAVLAAMLAGLGVDYAIHFRSHHDSIVIAGGSQVHACVKTARELVGPLTAACVTSIFGFATIALSDVRMLRDFALLGSIGLVGALLAVWCILPAILALFPSSARNTEPTEPVGFAGRLILIVTSRPEWSLAAGGAIGAAAVVAIALTPGLAPAFEPDPAVLHPQPNPALETGRVIRERFRSLGESLFVRIVGDSPDQLAIRAHQISERLGTSEAAAAGISDTLGLASLVPDPRRVPERLDALSAVDPDALIAGVKQVFDGSEFDAAAFKDYFAFLRRLLTGRPVPSVAGVQRWPELAQQLFPAACVDDPTIMPRQTIVLVRATNAASERSARAALIERIRTMIEGVPGATLTGLIVVSHDLEKAARRDLILFGSLSAALVVGWLVILLRSLIDVLLAFVPVLFSILCIFGVMSALGERLNPVNIVAFPLLAGIAVDSGIFLVTVAGRSARQGVDFRRALRPTVHAIICTTTTTAVGFGTLIWTHTPAVRSLGFVMLVGVMSSLGACFLILAPILALQSSSRERNAP